MKNLLIVLVLIQFSIKVYSQAELVKKICDNCSSSEQVGSDPREFVEMDEMIFFSAIDLKSNYTRGRELWISDGTMEGTLLLKDINPGEEDSNPENLTVYNGHLYFTADDGMHGRELWKTDGTESGTQMVIDIQLEGDSNPEELVLVNGTLYFSAYQHMIGRELFKTDGTESGTILVKDIYPGESNGVVNSGEVKNLINFKGTLFFTATDGIHGVELWKSSGTSLSTVMVEDIYPGGPSSNPENLTAIGNLLYFSAEDVDHGRELWKSDGTIFIGTEIVRDISGGSDSSYPTELTEVNGTLFFAAENSTYGRELWKSNGTNAGTVIVKNIDILDDSNPTFLTESNGILFFKAAAGVCTLWKSDGTEVGTEVVKDIPWGLCTSQHPVDVNGTLFFMAVEGQDADGVELWKSDGTSVGTVMVKNINPREALDAEWQIGSNPEELTNINGTLYFSADDGFHGRETWTSDGTELGTLLLKNINLDEGFFHISDFTTFKGYSFFNANDALFISDGTRNGTYPLPVKFGVFNTGAINIIEFKNQLYFVNKKYSLGKLDLLFDPLEINNDEVIMESVHKIPGDPDPFEIIVINGDLFYNGREKPVNIDLTGVELCKTEGIVLEDGKDDILVTITVKDINPTGDSRPKDLTNLNGILFFSANDGVNGRELWRSDGTESGTFMVKDINPVGSSSPKSLVNMGGNLYFSADDGQHGRQLWKSDGTPGGTLMVKNISNGGSWPYGLTVVNNILFFSAIDNTHGFELWKSDGSEAGTVLVKDINPGTGFSDPDHLINVNEVLYFSANNGILGRELWKSDGTEAGTVLIKDINPSAGSIQFPGEEGVYIENYIDPEFTDLNGTLYFGANDGVHGLQLWRSDGTLGGTVMIDELYTGGVHTPRELTDINGILYFSVIGKDNLLVSGSGSEDPWLEVWKYTPENICIPPEVDFTYEVPCNDASFTVNFTNISPEIPGNVEWSWDVNSDGVPDVIGEDLVYAFNQPGTYRVNLTADDGSGCRGTRTQYVEVAEFLIIDPTVTGVTCFGESDGTIILDVAGGFPPYTYNWSYKPDWNINYDEDLAPGEYSISVTDADACETSITVEVSEPSPLTFTLQIIKPVSCFAGSDGIALVVPEGGTPPYSYDWSHDGTSEGQIANNLPFGEFSVKITDSKGCKYEGTGFMTAPPPLAAGATIQKHVSCFGGSDGVVQINAGGGTPPYFYYWSYVTGPQPPVVGNVPAGDHIATIRDLNGCEFQVNITINEPDELVVSLDILQENECPNNSVGIIMATVSGGIEPYVYKWDHDPELGLSEAVDLAPGLYALDVFDDNGCQVGAHTELLANNNVAPLLTIPADITIECGDSFGPEATGYATAEDNCSELPNIHISYEDEQTVGICLGNQTINRTWTAIDEAGNTIAGTQVVTVVDTTPPSITAPAVVWIECDEPTDPSFTGSATASDFCSLVTIEYEDIFLEGSCPMERVIQRVWTAFDECQNTSSITQNISIIDTTQPVIAIPPDLFLECGESTDPASTGVATAKDACGQVKITFEDQTIPGFCGSNYTISRTWTATDECGNVNSETQSIEVKDTTPPVLESAPPDLVLECGENIPDPAVLTAFDVCDNTTVTVTLEEDINWGENEWEYRLTRRWTATDACDNIATVEQTIYVEDITAPTLDGVPEDITVECDAVPPPAEVTATDNCENEVTLSFEETRTDGMCAGEYTLLRTWSARDAVGNNISGSQQITVVDTTPPYLMTMADISIQGDENCQALVPSIDFQIDDNCSSVQSVLVTQDPPEGTILTRPGIFSITVTTVDECGNATTDAVQLTVEAPDLQVVCQDISVQLDASGNAAIVPELLDGGSSGGCGPLTFSIDRPEFTCDDVGENPVTLTVADSHQNIASCTAIVTVQDAIAPVVQCKSITVQLDDFGMASITASDILEMSDDECGIASLSIDQSTFTCDNLGANIVTLTATDINGNSSSCTAQVTVEDVIAPNVLCQDITVELDYTGNASITPADIDGGSSDACGIANLSIDKSSFSCSDIGENQVTLTVTDVNGNTSSCQTTVEVIDATAPVIITPENITQPNDPGSCSAVIALGELQVTDNCVVDIVTNDAPDPFPVGSTIVEWTASDVHGNTSTTLQTVTVTNNAPVISDLTGPDNPVFVGSEISISGTYSDDNISSAIVFWGDGEFSEALISGNTITGSHTYLDPGLVNIVLRVEDQCGETGEALLENIEIMSPTFEGFAKGVGFFDSPAGAYKPKPNASGRFLFGFLVKNRDTYTHPKGGTIFFFRAGRMVFSSNEYEFIRGNGGEVMFEGYGRANRKKNCQFQVIAVDGEFSDLDNFTSDALKIKIWNEEGVIYENDQTEIRRGHIWILPFGGDSQWARKIDQEYLPEDVESTPTLEELILEYGESNITVYPNPFAESVTIEYVPFISGHLSVRIFDLQGKIITTIFDDSVEEFIPYSWEFQPNEFLDHGVYMLRIEGGLFPETTRLIYQE